MRLHCLNTGYVVTDYILAHHTIPSPTSTSGYSAARIVIRGWLKGLKEDDSKEEMQIAWEENQKPSVIAVKQNMQSVQWCHSFNSTPFVLVTSHQTRSLLFKMFRQRHHMQNKDTGGIPAPLSETNLSKHQQSIQFFILSVYALNLMTNYKV